MPPLPLGPEKDGAGSWMAGEFKCQSSTPPSAGPASMVEFAVLVSRKTPNSVSGYLAVRYRSRKNVGDRF